MEIKINGKIYCKVSWKGPYKVLNGAVVDFSNKNVSDVTRGYLVFNSRNSSWEFKINLYNCLNYSIKRVALILESPHKDEYDILYNPLVPANGLTGKKIYGKLITKLSNKITLQPNEIYEIHLMNPIQYQCSLYHELEVFDFGAHIYGNGIVHNRIITNKVFSGLFFGRNSKHINYFRNDFIRRLKFYNPDIILNCCTSAKKNIVEKAIYVFNINKKNYVKLAHPSSW